MRKIEHLSLSKIESTIMNTVKYVRNADGHFVCPHCGVIKQKQNTMLYHIQSKHTMEFAYTCDRCPSENAPKFLQKCSYLHHLATIHPENPHLKDEKNPYAQTKYKCPMEDCTHTTHTRGNLSIHFVRNHLKDIIPSYSKKSACSCCNKTFGSSGAYLYHSLECFRNHIPDDYKRMLSLIK